MIDAQRAAGWPLADGADTVLLLDQPPMMLGAKAVDRLAPCAGVTLATGRVRSPIVAPERIEPLLMVGAVGTVGCELALAMLGILGVSFPVLFVAESHIRPPPCAHLDRPAPRRTRAKSPWLAGRNAAQEGREAKDVLRSGSIRGVVRADASLRARGRTEPRPVHGTTGAIRRNF
jgi:hypothetical protein